MRIYETAHQCLYEDTLSPQTPPQYSALVAGQAVFCLGLEQEVEERLPTDNPMADVLVPLRPRSRDELEQGLRALLLRAAQTRVRPQDVHNYFGERDLYFGPGGGGLLEIDGTLLALADGDFVGVLVRRGDASGAILFNPAGVVRIDPEATPLASRPRPHFMPSRRTRRQVQAANKRSKALLYRYLTPEEKWELRAHQFITITGQDGRMYRIHARWGGNVRLLEEGVATLGLCVVSTLPMPVLDLVLAHKVMLQNDIASFLKIANHFPLSPNPEHAPMPVFVGDP